MAIERGLLIDDAGAQRDVASGNRNLAEISHGRSDFRQSFDRHPEELTELAVPLPGLEIEQRGPGSGGDVGGENPGQPIQEKGVGRAEA